MLYFKINIDDIQTTPLLKRRLARSTNFKKYSQADLEMSPTRKQLRKWVDKCVRKLCCRDRQS